MKPVTITITEELDAAAAEEARRRGVSKSALVREGLRAVISGSDTTDAQDPDPWRDLAGFADPGVTTSEGEIDDVVYGRP